MYHIVDKVYESLLVILLKMQEKDEDIIVSYGGFNRTFTFCFTRKKAKYLSVLPEPFAHGGTSLYNSLADSFNYFKFEPKDEVLFVIATDGKDESYNKDHDIQRARTSLDVLDTLKDHKVVFVSLSQQADIQRTAADLGYTENDCVWGAQLNDMLENFVGRVLNEL